MATIRKIYNLCRDGKKVMQGTDMECLDYIHKNHSYSFTHAITHEGYSLSEQVKITADNTVTGHNRTIRFTGLPQAHQDDPTSIDVTINYTTEPNDGMIIHKAIALDHVIIPNIIRLFNQQ